MSVDYVQCDFGLNISRFKLKIQKKKKTCCTQHFHDNFLLVINAVRRLATDFFHGTAREYEKQFSFTCRTYFHFKLLKPLGRVVRKPINAKPGLKVNRGINFCCIKVLSIAYVL